MDPFEKLIGQKVTARIETDEKTHFVEGTVLSYDIDDYCFYEKQEPIYINVSLNPQFPSSRRY